MNKKLFDRPIVFQRIFVELTGSITSALLLSQSCYWSQRGKDGWFYKTQKEWEEETGMTRSELNTAKQKASKYLKTVVKSVPAKTYYFVDWEQLEKDCQITGNLQTGLQESDKLECTKPANTTYIYNTTKNTTDIISNSTKLQIEDFSSKEITEIINLFQDINPNYKRWFGNKSQRSAVKELIELMGFEKLSGLIKELPKISGILYSPQITTPYELLIKLPKLKIFLEQENKKINNNKKTISFIG